MTDVRFSKHALSNLALRGLSPQSVIKILSAPAWTAPDPQPSVTRAFGQASETGLKWIRVAFRYEPDGAMLVSTAFPDRDAKPPPGVS
jgi:hypothetical protein